MKARHIRTVLALTAATTLAAGLGATSASASLVSSGCGSANYVEVMYSPGGNVRYECFSGLGLLNTNVPNVDWVKAGEYWTYVEVHYSSGYASDCLAPGATYDIGNATLEQLDTTTTSYC
jgi:hypothetical protein